MRRFHIVCFTAVLSGILRLFRGQNDSCQLYIYTDPEGPPQKRHGEACPNAYPAQAFIDIAYGSNDTKPLMKEVMPDPAQPVFCLANRPCMFVVRGIGLTTRDAVIILPEGSDTCPPSSVPSPQGSHDDHDEAAIVVQGETFLQLPNHHISHVLFHVPDRYVLNKGHHVLCYAPARMFDDASTIGLDEFPAPAFAYKLGPFYTTNRKVFRCTFEEEASDFVYNERDFTQATFLPCGFHNARDQYTIDLVWALGSGRVDVPDTGPAADVTKGLNGQGHYLFMGSPGYALGATATLMSPPIFLPSSTRKTFCISYFYHMYGVDVSSLRVYVRQVPQLLHGLQANLHVHSDLRHLAKDKPENDRSVEDFALNKDWGSPRWVAVGNKGDVWHRGGFQYTAENNDLIQVIFEAVAGNSEQAYIALDNVDVAYGGCPRSVREAQPKSIAADHAGMVCGEVRLNTGDHAVDKAWYVDGAISCSGRGYSVDHLNASAWLPCCIPRLGKYQLVLEDLQGDGWQGSFLEFRFFNQVYTFNGNQSEPFQSSGYFKHYALVIGALEIVGVQFDAFPGFTVAVQVAQPTSSVWCGLVKARLTGDPTSVRLNSTVMKTYGVRSDRRSKTPNDVVHVAFSPQVVVPDATYDVYCYSETLAENATTSQATSLATSSDDDIMKTRFRVSTDRTPPRIQVLQSAPEPHQITLDVTLDETGTLWCLAEKNRTAETPGKSPSVFATLANLPSNTTKELNWAIAQIKGLGAELHIDGPKAKDSVVQITIPSLVPNTLYNVLCYAEDVAVPQPNGLRAPEVLATYALVKTVPKAPVVRVQRHVTLHEGFAIGVSLDAPGRVWCAAAPAFLETPAVQDVVDMGVFADVDDAFAEHTLTILGVEQSTKYAVYCVAGILGTGAQLEFLSSPQEMERTKAEVMSYGQFCDISQPTIEVMKDLTPFHPLNPDEEITVRNFILAQGELDLKGVYRITLLPNKTEIYAFYDEGGPKPLRYARVRAGRCQGNVGYYEQFRVGPLETPNNMSYVRLARPVATDCGGYAPQGVFGKRRLEARAHGVELDVVDAFEDFLRASFNLSLFSLDCQTTSSSSAAHCLRIGPLFVEDGPRNASVVARLWIGLKTVDNEPLPLYFVRNFTSAAEFDAVSPNLLDHAHALLLGEGSPLLRVEDRSEFQGLFAADMLLYDNRTVVWFDRVVYADLRALLSDPRARGRFTPDTFRARRLAVSAKTANLAKTASPEAVNTKMGKTASPKAVTAKKADNAKMGKTASPEAVITKKAKKERVLAPQPFYGAAGTAGPLPSRLNRRGDLEYKAVPEHIEPQGRRYKVEASADQEAFTITYLGWSMTVTNDRDTALRIYNLRFMNKRVAFELGLMEALAHYTTSERNWFFLDSWYGGLGSAARRVHKGIECPKTATSLFFDGSLCVFEQDMARPLRAHWKSGELRDGAPHVALVFRQMLTVSNYDYLTDYYFHSTGMFESTVSFTGELYAGIEVPWYSERQKDYGVQVTGAMRLAALHTHMVVWKIDLDIGDQFEDNSVLLTEVIADPRRPGANKLNRTFAETEMDAALMRNDSRLLVYEVVSESIRIFDNVGGYRIVPGAAPNVLHHDYELYRGPAAWAKYTVASTVRKYDELDSTLPRDNKYADRPAVSLDRYVEDDEPVRHRDVVTWVADGVYHLPVIEDMPNTIPIGNTLRWLAKPANLFYEDPSMDLWNAMGGGVEDPGTCAVLRLDIGEVEPTMQNTWSRKQAFNPYQYVSTS